LARRFPLRRKRPASWTPKGDVRDAGFPALERHTVNTVEFGAPRI